MSLEMLFEDRRIRKSIRDKVNEAREIGKGSCYCCEEEKPLLLGFGKCLCESCISKAFEMADDYSVAYSGDISDSDVIDYIKEGYVIPDMVKLNKDAKDKFGGSIPDLLTSYGLRVHKDWNDKISMGKIYIAPSDHKGTKKSRLNQFMIDYSCQFASEKVALSHQPDADGTMVDLIVNGVKIDKPSNSTPNTVSTVPQKVLNQSAPVTSNKAKSQSSSNSVTQVSTGYIGGNLNHFTIQIGGSEELDVELIDTSGSKSLSVSFDGSSVSYNVKDDEVKDLKTAVETVKSKVLSNPQSIFRAFSGNSNGEFEINKYSIYKFCLDEYSFGKELTFSVIWNGKKHSSTRVKVPAKALTNVSLLNTELTNYLDSMVEKKFPALAKGRNKFKTSVGTATFELIGIEAGKNDKESIALLGVDLGGVYFEVRIQENRLKDSSGSKDAFAEALTNALFNSPSILNKKGTLLKGTQVGKADYSYETELDGKKFTVYGLLDPNNELYLKGDIAIGISVIDDHTGEEQPKKREIIVIRDTGKDINEILNIEGRKIYTKYFKDSNMTGKMTDSALNKMKSSGKKEALMSKIADKFVESATKIYSISKKLEDLDVEIDMDVNKDGKPTRVIIRVTDFNSEYATDSRELAKVIELDKLKWIKFKKADPVMKEGPSVTYEVTDIEEFSTATRLLLIENEIFSAFGLVRVTESVGRKTFHI